jgi:hypothetical protein
MTITSCTWSPSACPGNDGGAETRYRVVFGSGHGEIRSQGQAKADLYTEIRDRTQAGEWLDAESRTPASSCGPRDLGRGSAPVSKASGDGDPLTQCALTLLDLVDGVGEVGIDVIHGGLPEARTPDGGAAPGCSVSLGRQTGPDALRCLVEAPERAHRPGR